MKTLGIIGGVGPLATMYYGDKIVRMTDAEKDQDHINMIILNDTTIPDRTDYILDHTQTDPVPYLIKDAIQLEMMGADIITIPCNTAHTFYEDIQRAVNVPVIHMVDETVQRVAAKQAKRVGILATSGTIAAKVFQHSCEKAGLTPVLPDEATQRDVMTIIYDQVKAGRPADAALWNQITEAMETKECDYMILGCTELSIVKTELGLDSRFVDTLHVLAETTITRCGASLR